MKEIPSGNHDLHKALRHQLRSYRMSLTSDGPSLTSEIHSSLIPEKIEVGTTEDYTRIKTEDWHIRVVHPSTGRIILVSYRPPESITINGHNPFFSDSDVLDMNSMIESGDINDKPFASMREILDYKSTEIPPRKEDEGEFSPLQLCLDTLSLRMQETKTPQP